MTLSDANLKFQQALDAIRRGNRDEGRALLRALNQAHPLDPNAAFALASLVADEGDISGAVQAIAPLETQSAGAAAMIVRFLSHAGRVQEAAARGKSACARFPADTPLALLTASAFSALPDYESAESILRAQFDRRPDGDVASALSSAILNLGRCKEAVEFLDAAISQLPADVACLAAIANASNFVSTSREEGFRKHGAFARLIEFSIPASNPLGFPNEPDPDRPLKIAVVSNDLRAHSVAYFVEAILRFHDRSRYIITAFSSATAEDAVSDRLRPLADRWKRANGSPRQLAREIAAERPDVAVDLGGLTGGSSIAALVPQIAPVQLTAIGYPNTTGFRAIQYRFADARTDPPGDSDKYSAEQLVRLDPCFLCFTPRTIPSSIRAPSGPVKFGSFNRITKYSDDCLRAWARILNAVPGSELVLKSPALDSAVARSFLGARLASFGAPVERVRLVGKQPAERDHLAMYEQIDIALDSFPYNGTTTTCEALLMGVPVIGLVGSTHAGRVGLSLLSAAGWPEDAAPSIDLYVARAAEHAASIDAIRAERSARSKQFLASALCDGPAYAARWQDAIRSMWRTWCERKRNQSSSSAPR